MKKLFAILMLCAIGQTVYAQDEFPLPEFDPVEMEELPLPDFTEQESEIDWENFEGEEVDFLDFLEGFEDEMAKDHEAWEDAQDWEEIDELNDFDLPAEEGMEGEFLEDFEELQDLDESVFDEFDEKLDESFGEGI